MTDEELEAIAKRWDGGAHVQVWNEPDGRQSITVPYADDVKKLVAEVRRLRTHVRGARMVLREVEPQITHPPTKAVVSKCIDSLPVYHEKF